MAVQEQTPYIEHAGNGVTTSFALEFECKDKEHLIVLVDNVEPNVGTWSLANGSVVFGIAPADGKIISIQRNTPFRRDTNFQSYDNSLRPATINKDFDWIWYKLQELGVADWILSARIDALKNYVDRKDDELKAYLMEEIRKQGVALDQLDEYYNYLMERLAQIAVDKGWDASFVVDASGKTQQQINTGLFNLYNPLSLHHTLAELSANFTASLNTLITNVSLDGGGTISIPDGTFYINPAIGITLKDDIELRLGKNTVLRNINHELGQYEMIRAWDVGNVKISGGKIDGNRSGNSATSGEWGMGISIRGSKDVTVRDMDVSNCWGDGIYVGRTESADCTDGLLVENITSSNCRRQGISVISLKNATFNQLTLKDVNGIKPSAGIDFEPNHADEWLQNITVNGLHTENCQGAGIQLYYSPLGWRVWNSSTSYLTGNVVEHNSSYYKAKRANTGVTPSEVSADWLHLPDFDAVSDRVSITVNGHVDRGSMRGFYSLGQQSKTNVSGKFILNNASYLNKNNHNIFTQNNVADGVQVYINDPELINDNTDANIQHVRISNAPADYSLGGVHLLRPKFKCIGVDTSCVYIYANNNNGLANKNISILDIVERPAGVVVPVQMIARRVENLQLRDQFNQNRLNSASSSSINDVALFESYYINSGSSTFNINSFLAGRTIKILNEHTGVATVNLAKAGSDIVGVTNSSVRTFTLRPGGSVELFAISDTLLRVVRSSGLINLSKSSRGTIPFPATTFAANESKLIATVATLTADRYTDTVSVSSTIDLVGNIALSATINTNGTIRIYGTNLKASSLSYGAAGQYLNVVVR